MPDAKTEKVLWTLLERVIAENRPHRWRDQLKQYNPYEDINGDYYRDNIRLLHPSELDGFTRTLIEDANYRSEAEKILANLLIDPEKSRQIKGGGFLEGGIFGISYLYLLRRAFAELRAAETDGARTADAETDDEAFDRFIRNLSADACLTAIRATAQSAKT
ncbi:MAG: hypothetical protein LBH21_04725 [Gracilibacteraceae bacterium]|nr:hypothetical protein [Gracilibacteraceae bacterium]